MSTESRMSRMETILAALAGAAGLDLDDVETPKTTARMGHAKGASNMALKGKPILKKKSSTAKSTAPVRSSSREALDELTLENVGGNRSDGRMRLPAKMFGKYDSISVDGHKFHKLASDQNRSANFSPSILGADVGDDVTFIREGGSKWTCEVSAGSGRKRKAKPSVSKAPAKKPQVKSAAPARGTRVGTDVKALLKDTAKKFGKLARENAAEDFVNENIVESTKFEDDPRVYLTSRENAQAKRVWKRQAGIALSEWVKMLSAEVYQ